MTDSSLHGCLLVVTVAEISVQMLSFLDYTYIMISRQTGGSGREYKDV